MEVGGYSAAFRTRVTMTVTKQRGMRQSDLRFWPNVDIIAIWQRHIEYNHNNASLSENYYFFQVVSVYLMKKKK